MKKRILLLGLPILFAGTLAFGTKADAADQNPIWRAYNPNSGEHFYTKHLEEWQGLMKAGWQDENIGWYAPDDGEGAPVYRLYNQNAGDHFFTMDESEKALLLAQGWSDEGPAWYSDPKEGTPIHRAYNPNAITGAHNYTARDSEQKGLIAASWKDEGIAWYGVAPVWTKENTIDFYESMFNNGTYDVEAPIPVKDYNRANWSEVRNNFVVTVMRYSDNANDGTADYFLISEEADGSRYIRFYPNLALTPDEVNSKLDSIGVIPGGPKKIYTFDPAEKTFKDVTGLIN